MIVPRTAKQVMLTAQIPQTNGEAACTHLELHIDCPELLLESNYTAFGCLTFCTKSAEILFACRKAEPPGACLAVETCNGRRVRTWTRGGVGDAPVFAAEVKAPGSQAPAYLNALQAFLPDGYPASVTPDYLRALPMQACSCSLKLGAPSNTAGYVFTILGRYQALRGASAFVPQALAAAARV